MYFFPRVKKMMMQIEIIALVSQALDIYVQSVYIIYRKYLYIEQSKTLPSQNIFNILFVQFIALKSDGSIWYFCNLFRQIDLNSINIPSDRRNNYHFMYDNFDWTLKNVALSKIRSHIMEVHEYFAHWKINSTCIVSSYFVTG